MDADRIGTKCILSTIKTRTFMNDFIFFKENMHFPLCVDIKMNVCTVHVDSIRSMDMNVYDLWIIIMVKWPADNDISYPQKHTCILYYVLYNVHVFY